MGKRRGQPRGDVWRYEDDEGEEGEKGVGIKELRGKSRVDKKGKKKDGRRVDEAKESRDLVEQANRNLNPTEEDINPSFASLESEADAIEHLHQELQYLLDELDPRAHEAMISHDPPEVIEERIERYQALAKRISQEDRRNIDMLLNMVEASLALYKVRYLDRMARSYAYFRLNNRDYAWTEDFFNQTSEELDDVDWKDVNIKGGFTFYREDPQYQIHEYRDKMERYKKDPVCYEFDSAFEYISEKAHDIKNDLLYEFENSPDVLMLGEREVINPFLDLIEDYDKLVEWKEKITDPDVLEYAESKMRVLGDFNKSMEGWKEFLLVLESIKDDISKAKKGQFDSQELTKKLEQLKQERQKITDYVTGEMAFEFVLGVEFALGDYGVGGFSDTKDGGFEQVDKNEMTQTQAYQFLGLESGASLGEVKKMVRKLSREFHPDFNPGDKTAEDKLKDVLRAYRIINPKVEQKIL